MSGQEESGINLKVAAVEIEKILLEQIELAKPDSLAFLEFQVPYIAGRIVRYFDSLHGQSK